MILLFVFSFFRDVLFLPCSLHLLPLILSSPLSFTLALFPSLLHSLIFSLLNPLFPLAFTLLSGLHLSFILYSPSLCSSRFLLHLILPRSVFSFLSLPHSLVLPHSPVSLAFSALNPSLLYSSSTMYSPLIYSPYPSPSQWHLPLTPPLFPLSSLSFSLILPSLPHSPHSSLLSLTLHNPPSSPSISS